jgi:hypothetical protein
MGVKLVGERGMEYILIDKDRYGMNLNIRILAQPTG